MKIKLIFLVIFPIILNAQSFDLVCKKNDNEITEKSLIKDTSPNTIEIITQDTSLNLLNGMHKILKCTLRLLMTQISN